MKNKSSSGSAMLCAVLVVVIIIASLMAAVMVWDRNSVDENYVPASAESSQTDSSMQDSGVQNSLTDSSVDDSSLMPAVEYPTEASDYKNVTDKDFTAGNAVLIDADNNTVVAGKNYDEKIYPASLTKVMTILVAAENIQSMDETYTFTYDDLHPLVEANASRADFSVGEKVTANDLMNAAILVSGADGTLGLSNMISGSEKAFVELMNKKAEEMGLKNTHFTNASGLHNKNHYSTAEDMAVILKTAMENDVCKNVLTSKTYTSSKTKQHKNGITMHSIVFNRLIDYYVEGGGEITGGKTGFISESKYSLATTYEHNGKNYVCVTSKST
ncbi:MAG: D-alanyl-D-alanine carboxypeptidase family protein, partial [Oscillospiraceae bacterium]